MKTLEENGANSEELNELEEKVTKTEESIIDIETEIAILQEADVTINGNIENLGTQEELSKDPEVMMLEMKVLRKI